MHPPNHKTVAKLKGRKPARTLESLRNEFHPTRNGTLRFDDLTHGSSKKVWWTCSNACCETLHEWEAVVCSRVGQHGRCCPFCAKSNGQTCRCKSLGARFPESSAQLVDKTVDAFKIAASSRQKLTWRCENQCCETEHVWEARVGDRTHHGSGCPFCSTGGQTCRCKSFGTLFPDIAAQLSDKTIDPLATSASSGQTFKWQCGNACCETEHVWEARVKDRTMSGHGCPFCSSGGQTCRCKSFGTLFPDIAAQLSDKTIDPLATSASSGQKLRWLCENRCCETVHEWETTVENRTRLDNGCPFCSGRQTCRCKSLGTRFPEIAAQLVDKTVETFNISAFSGTRFMWRCDICTRRWETSVNCRTGKRTGCPICNINKGEARLEELCDSSPVVERHWKTPIPCVDTYSGNKVRHLVPDKIGITVTGNLFAIELDGPQHFESVPHFGNTWTDLVDQMRRDLAKNRTLWQSNHSLLRVSYLEFDRLDEIVRGFLDVVNRSSQKILRTSNDDLYRDLQCRARVALEN